MSRITVILWESGLRAEVFTSKAKQVRVTPVEDDAEHYSVHIDLLPEFDHVNDYVVRVVQKGDRRECQLLAGSTMPAWVLWTNGKKRDRRLIASHVIVTRYLDTHVFRHPGELEELRRRGIQTEDANPQTLGDDPMTRQFDKDNDELPPFKQPHRRPAHERTDREDGLPPRRRQPPTRYPQDTEPDGED